MTIGIHDVVYSEESATFKMVVKLHVESYSETLCILKIYAKPTHAIVGTPHV